MAAHFANPQSEHQLEFLPLYSIHHTSPFLPIPNVQVKILAVFFVFLFTVPRIYKLLIYNPGQEVWMGLDLICACSSATNMLSFLAQSSIPPHFFHHFYLTKTTSLLLHLHFGSRVSSVKLIWLFFSPFSVPSTSLNHPSIC